MFKMKTEKTKVLSFISQVQRERLECAVALLSHGCEVNVEDEDGNTPLHIAAQKKIVSVVQALCVFGADLDRRFGSLQH